MRALASVNAAVRSASSVLAGGVDSLASLGLDRRQLRLVLGDLGLGCGASGVGGLVIAADLSVAGIHALLQAREEHEAHEHEQHDERAGAPRQLFDLRGDRARTCVLGGRRGCHVRTCGRLRTTTWPAAVVVTVTVSTGSP